MTDLRQTLETTLGGTYRIERELGGGGMSKVFLAEEPALGRRVVLKVLPEAVMEGVNADRFRREMQVSARLQHPHIVPLLSSGEIAGRPYFVMPYIEGESLRARLATQQEIPLGEAVRYLRQVASALAYAHKHGIVHRDVKPDNVLVNDGFALVTDFGVAKALDAASEKSASSGALTTVGVALGTPAYMAPEQAAADPATDHRADIYAFGLLAYELLTGLPPFHGRSPQALFAAHAVETPESPDKRRAGLPPALVDLVLQCLEKDPADRPQTAAEIVDVLEGVDTGTGSGKRATRTWRRRTATRSRRTIIVAAAGAAVLLLVGVGGYMISRTRAQPSASTDGGELSSVAVLPLENLGGNSEDEYFSEGMTDELANALNKLPGLRVASRTSAYAFKGRRDVDVGEIGRRLKVQAVLEGTVRRAGNRLRVSTQLTSVSDGLALWSEIYERQASDVFQVQDDIARSIAEALKPRLRGGNTQAIAANARGTENLEAFDLYLRGRYYWNRRGAENLRRAIDYFNQAIARDPQFGRAYASLSMAYALLPEYTDSPPPQVVQRTRTAVERALSIDSTLVEAHTAEGLTSVHEWEWERARESYRRALADDPTYATAHQWYGELLYQIGRIDSSLTHIRAAAELDPLAEIIPSALGYTLTLARRDDEAIQVLRRGVEISPTLGLHRAVLAHALLLKGDMTAAVREMEEAARLDPEIAHRLGQLAYTYARSGNRDKALATLQRLQEKARSGRVSPVAFAVAYIGLGDHERAFAELQRAVGQRDISLLTAFTLVADRMYDPIRSDPRFAQILTHMDLRRYAR